MAGKVDSLTAAFENRIGFWLKKSPLETTPGELVELANLLNELADVSKSIFLLVFVAYLCLGFISLPIHRLCHIRVASTHQVSLSYSN
jgi:hypothetical protein